MFLGLDSGPLMAGHTSPAPAVFETAGARDVVFNIEVRMPGPVHAADHSGHSATD